MGAKPVEVFVRRVAVGAAVALAAFVALAAPPSVEHWTAAAFFASFGVAASALAYRTSNSTLGTISFLPSLSAALIAPNVATLVAVLVSSSLAEFLLRRERIKAVFNVAQQVSSVAAAVATYLLLGGSSVLEHAPRVVPFLGLGLVYFSLNKLAVSTVVAISTGGSTRQHWLKSVRGSLLYDLLAFPLILLFAVAFSRMGPGWSAMLALPMLGVRQLYQSVFALQQVNRELLQLMVASIEARDPYTSGHSQRVSRYAKVIAAAAGLGERATDRVATAALLHDVGKIHEEFAVILRKPGRLTDDEFAVMKTHPARSAELVTRVSQFSDIVSSVRAHHEAWDGSGYPDQLAGERIPLAARIIAFADTIDAMTTSRPYRDALSAEQVRVELEKQSGVQFDPRICAELLRPTRWHAMMQEIALANAEFPATYLYGVEGGTGRTGEFHVRKGAPQDSMRA